MIGGWMTSSRSKSAASMDGSIVENLVSCRQVKLENTFKKMTNISYCQLREEHLESILQWKGGIKPSYLGKKKNCGH
jgi:hypothetical protein